MVIEGGSAVLAGRPLADRINDDTGRRAEVLAGAGCPPMLAVIAGADDEAASRYGRSLERAGQRVGVRCVMIGVAAEGLAEAVAEESRRPGVHGVLVQTPLPGGFRLAEVVADMDPVTDVDGAHPLSVGRTALGLDGFWPATAEAVMEILDYYSVPLSGRRVAVVGRSSVVGRPVAQLLTARDATVTLCHSRTPDLADITASAEVVVAAAGKPHFLGARHLRVGATVVDVGTTVGDDGVMRGDVNPALGDGHVGALTPVPGGLGPVTTAVLLRHTVDAAERIRW